MRLSENFTMAEFTKSQTAERRGIDNTPEGEHLDAAVALFENVVQKVRDHFGPTVINSDIAPLSLTKQWAEVHVHSTAKAKRLTSKCQEFLTQNWQSGFVTT